MNDYAERDHGVAMTHEEIYKECLDNNHAARVLIAEGRWVPTLCNDCQKKIDDSIYQARVERDEQNYKLTTSNYSKTPNPILSHDDLLVEMFGQEDTVSVAFYDGADKALVEGLIKDNLIRKAKGQNYSPISEPVISIYEYLKIIGEGFMPVPDKAEADLIVLRTTVKVVKGQLK